jgi:hypothetical protein
VSSTLAFMNMHNAIAMWQDARRSHEGQLNALQAGSFRPRWNRADATAADAAACRSKIAELDRAILFGQQRLASALPVR